KELKTWALFGPPLGRSWQPTFDEKSKYPEVEPLAGNPWTVLHAAPPPEVKAEGPAVVDLHPLTATQLRRPAPRARPAPPPQPAWHGTILPAEDGDVWLAAAFADYQPLAALERAFRQRSAGRTDLLPEERERLSVGLYRFKADYTLGSRAA